MYVVTSGVQLILVFRFKKTIHIASVECLLLNNAEQTVDYRVQQLEITIVAVKIPFLRKMIRSGELMRYCYGSRNY